MQHPSPSLTVLGLQMADEAYRQGWIGRFSGISFVLGEPRIDKARDLPPADSLQYRHPAVWLSNDRVMFGMGIQHHRSVISGHAALEPFQSVQTRDLLGLAFRFSC